MKRLVLGCLFIFYFLFVFSACCQTDVVSPPVLSGPDLAHQTIDETVALVSNFGDMDKQHAAFCTGVWIGDRTILTAHWLSKLGSNTEFQKKLLD